MKQTFWPLVALAGLIIMFVGGSQLLKGQGGAQDLATGLKSPDVEKRRAAAEKIISDRRQLISELLALAQQKGASTEVRGTKELAIDLLGKYRSEEAISLLIREIAFAPPSINSELSPLNGYPSARALVSIGERSVTEILAFVHPDVDQKAMKLYAEVIREVDGAEVGRFRINRALAGNITGSKRAGLEELLRVYDKHERI